MARIKLEPSTVRRLEIEKPDGKIFILELKPLLVSEADRVEVQNKENERLYAKGEITSIEYLFRTWENMIKNFDRADFAGFEFEHLNSIGEALNELRRKKTDEEKKNQS